MFNFGKRAAPGVLPPALQGSIRLTAGLQGAIRTQYIIAGMTVFGAILGAVLAAWLVLFVPGIWHSLAFWNDMSFSFSGPGVLNALNWAGRVVGVFMGAIVVATFFRHVTYTVVAKSLLALKKQPDLSDDERAWVDFELASMAAVLDKSGWVDGAVIPHEGLTLIWLVIAAFAQTGLVTLTPEVLMVAAQLFVFLAIFTLIWIFVFRAPMGLTAGLVMGHGVEESERKLKEQLGLTGPVKPILVHAAPLYAFCSHLICLALLAIVLGGATRIYDSELRESERKEAVTDTVRNVYAYIETAQPDQRHELLAQLATSQKIGGYVNWAIFPGIKTALGKETPFVSSNCVGLSFSPMEDNPPVLCSTAGKASIDYLKMIFYKYLPKTEWEPFIYANQTTK